VRAVANKYQVSDDVELVFVKLFKNADLKEAHWFRLTLTETVTQRFLFTGKLDNGLLNLVSGLTSPKSEVQDVLQKGADCRRRTSESSLRWQVEMEVNLENYQRRLRWNHESCFWAGNQELKPATNMALVKALEFATRRELTKHVQPLPQTGRYFGHIWKAKM